MAKYRPKKASWDLFYEEIDPAHRSILIKILVQRPDSGKKDADYFRWLLFVHRHPSRLRPASQDNALQGLMRLMMVQRNKPAISRSVQRHKDLNDIFDLLGWSTLQLHGCEEAEADRLFYAECCNVIRAYIQTTKSPQYARTFYGLIPASKAGQEKRAKEDRTDMLKALEYLADDTVDVSEKRPADLLAKAIQECWVISSPAKESDDEEDTEENTIEEMGDGQVPEEPEKSESPDEEPRFN